MSKIIKADYNDIMEDCYTEYALSVAMGRALPDVRDGLKWVHRRILTSMNELGLVPEKGYRKCARVVGDTLGKYHPHGDSAVYGALVRLAQEWSLRYMLVDGHGNFGSIDGDNPAHMRYCVTGDTLVNTDKGLFRIKDLVEESIDSEQLSDINILSINNKTNHVSKFFNSGVHPIKEVVTKCGYSIKGSYNHPLTILSADDNGKPVLVWKRLDELKKGDFLVINRNDGISSNVNSATENEAKFLGGMISEGFASRNQAYHRIGFNNSNIEFVADMKEWFSEIFGKETFISEREFSTINHEKCQEICIHNKEKHIDFIKNYEFGDSYEKVIPKVILESSLHIQSLFLRYLYEGDGSVYEMKQGRYIMSCVSYSSCNLKLIRQIQIVLLQFGIYSSIKSDRENFRLLIHGNKNINLFYEKINFAYHEKQNKLEKIVDYYNEEKAFSNFGYDTIPFIAKYIRGNNKYAKSLFSNNFSNKKSFEKNKNLFEKFLSSDNYRLLEDMHKLDYLYLPVEEINDLEDETVYCIKVDSECHSFVANGFINHNTESKMQEIALEMLRDINKNTVDYIPNFDGEEKEPTVLPSRFPNFLVNGSKGIAVGFATNIPTHNLTDTIDTIIYQMENPNCSIKELVDILKAPDFPTGGQILNPDEMLDMYTNGEGKVVMRAKYHTEIEEKTVSIIITELPYQVVKSKLVEEIDMLTRETISKKKGKEEVIKPKTDGIKEVLDESDREGMRIRITLKKGVSVDKMLSILFKHTELQCNFGANFTAIYKTNKLLEHINLKEINDFYIEHQKEILSRRTQFDLDKSAKRLHVLEGLKIALLDIDETIKNIKTSKNKKEAKEKLKSTLQIDEEQADYILELKLHRLTGLEIEDINTEHKELESLVASLESILNNEKNLLNLLKKELLEIKEKYGDGRKTEIVYENTVKEITKADLIEDYSTYCILTKVGYLKKLLRRSEDVKLKDDDEIVYQTSSSNKSTLLLFSNKGCCYKLYQHELDECKPTDILGAYLPNILSLEKDEYIISMISTRRYSGYLLNVFENGLIAKVNMESFKTKTMRSKLEKALNMDSKLVQMIDVEKDIDILLTTQEGKCLILNTEKINSKGSKDTKGVVGINLGEYEGNRVVGCILNVTPDSSFTLSTKKKKEVNYILNDVSPNGNGTMHDYFFGRIRNAGSFIYNCRAKNDTIVEFTLNK